MKNAHYASSDNSDHLSAADVFEMEQNGQSTIVTIKKAGKEFAKVAGKEGEYKILYFEEDVKPLVLNTINGERIANFHPTKSPMLFDWVGIKIELYADTKVKFGKKVVGGVRVRTKQPRLEPKPLPTITDDRFSKLLDAIEAGNYTKDKAIKSFSLTADQKQKLNA